MQALGELLASIWLIVRVATASACRHLQRLPNEIRVSIVNERSAVRREKSATVSSFGRSTTRGADAALVASGLRGIGLPCYGHLGNLDLAKEDQITNLNARVAAIESLFGPPPGRSYPAPIVGCAMSTDPGGPYLCACSECGRLALDDSPVVWTCLACRADLLHDQGPPGIPPKQDLTALAKELGITGEQEQGGPATPQVGVEK